MVKKYFHSWEIKKGRDVIKICFSFKTNVRIKKKEKKKKSKNFEVYYFKKKAKMMIREPGSVVLKLIRLVARSL